GECDACADGTYAASDTADCLAHTVCGTQLTDEGTAGGSRLIEHTSTTAGSCATCINGYADPNDADGNGNCLVHTVCDTWQIAPGTLTADTVCGTCTPIDNIAEGVTVTCSAQNQSRINPDQCMTGFVHVPSSGENTNDSCTIIECPVNASRPAESADVITACVCNPGYEGDLRLNDGQTAFVEGSNSCEAITCGENEYVSSNECEMCPGGTSNVEGNDASGDDTECTPIICTIPDPTGYVISGETNSNETGLDRSLRVGGESDGDQIAFSVRALCNVDDGYKSVCIGEDNVIDYNRAQNECIEDGETWGAVVEECTESGPYLLKGCVKECGNQSPPESGPAISRWNPATPLQCDPCDDGTWAESDSDDCVSRLDDCTGNQVDGSLRYNEGTNTCDPCDGGTWASSDSENCVDGCPTGMADCSTTGEASTCSPGYRKEGNNCIECVIGKYIVTNGHESTECIPCPAGKTTSEAGTTLAEECIDCVIGKYSDGLTGTCTDSSGTTDVTRESECTGDGKTFTLGCISCPTGKTTSEAGANLATECDVCSPGYGGVDCAMCVAGKYSTGECTQDSSITSKDDCLEGNNTWTYLCRDCTSTENSDAGSSSCTDRTGFCINNAVTSENATCTETQTLTTDTDQMTDCCIPRSGFCINNAVTSENATCTDETTDITTDTAKRNDCCIPRSGFCINNADGESDATCTETETLTDSRDSIKSEGNCCIPRAGYCINNAVSTDDVDCTRGFAGRLEDTTYRNKPEVDIINLQHGGQEIDCCRVVSDENQCQAAWDNGLCDGDGKERDNRQNGVCSDETLTTEADCDAAEGEGWTLPGDISIEAPEGGDPLTESQKREICCTDRVNYCSDNTDDPDFVCGSGSTILESDRLDTVENPKNIKCGTCSDTSVNTEAACLALSTPGTWTSTCTHAECCVPKTGLCKNNTFHESETISQVAILLGVDEPEQHEPDIDCSVTDDTVSPKIGPMDDQTAIESMPGRSRRECCVPRENLCGADGINTIEGWITEEADGRWSGCKADTQVPELEHKVGTINCGTCSDPTKTTEAACTGTGVQWTSTPCTVPQCCITEIADDLYMCAGNTDGSKNIDCSINDKKLREGICSLWVPSSCSDVTKTTQVACTAAGESWTTATCSDSAISSPTEDNCVDLSLSQSACTGTGKTWKSMSQIRRGTTPQNTCCEDITGMCTGNTPSTGDQDRDNDWCQTQPITTLIDGVEVGTGINYAGAKTGTCKVNGVVTADASATDCVAGGGSWTSSESEPLIGREAALCCVTTGQCSGNTDGTDDMNDVWCRARNYSGAKTGTCSDNTSITETACSNGGGTWDPAGIPLGREGALCCEVISGLCTGNTIPADDFTGCPTGTLPDPGSTKPTVESGTCSDDTITTETECTSPNTWLSNSVETCCKITNRCFGNTDDPDVTCGTEEMFIDPFNIPESVEYDYLRNLADDNDIGPIIEDTDNPSDECCVPKRFCYGNTASSGYYNVNTLGRTETISDENDSCIGNEAAGCAEGAGCTLLDDVENKEISASLPLAETLTECCNIPALQTHHASGSSEPPVAEVERFTNMYEPEPFVNMYGPFKDKKNIKYIIEGMSNDGETLSRCDKIKKELVISLGIEEEQTIVTCKKSKKGKDLITIKVIPSEENPIPDDINEKIEKGLNLPGLGLNIERRITQSEKNDRIKKIAIIVVLMIISLISGVFFLTR
ncbi:MAG: hypothetical protein CMM25_00380, partial [Rhodospirillaceae bacterium]|nr:hypothetical protein [Rhodospirillaceae bacterium]